LQGIGLWSNDLTRWNLSGQNLTSANLSSSTLFNANLAGANLNNATLIGSTLTYANLPGANLTGATLNRSTLTNANLTGADTRGAQSLDLSGATTGNAILPDGSIAGLNLAAGETLVAYADVPIAVRIVGAFSIDPTAKLDVTDNAAIVDYSGASPASTIREKVLSGRGGPGIGASWNGNGITSSTAAAANQAQPNSRSLGYAENAALPLGPLTTFHGASVDSTSVLIAFTRTGDANLDGAVNDDDVTIIGANYSPGVPQPSWALGDFDYNGFVDDDDVTLLGAFYDPAASAIGGLPTLATSAIAAAVPEPGTLWLVAAIALPALATSLRVKQGRQLCPAPRDARVGREVCDGPGKPEDDAEPSGYA
jgi:hypothetical protein